MNWDDTRRIAVQFARRWCQSTADAEDVAQTALLEAVRQHARIVLTPVWLYVVTRRTARRMQLQGARQVTHAVVHARAEDGYRGLDDRLYACELLRFLNARDRRLLRLWAQGCSHAEIARRFSWSERDVGTRVARALRRARAYASSPRERGTDG